jgi:glycosyltransferase involved in cell wall biosynthesis
LHGAGALAAGLDVGGPEGLTMRVVQIVTQMEAAGAQAVAYQLHEGLSGKGHDSELWFLYMKRPAYVGLRGVSSLMDHPPSAGDYPAIVGRLYRRLRQHRCDAVITHTQYANVLGQTVAAAVGVKKRIAVHHSPRAKDSFLPRIADYLLGHTDIYSDIVVVSESLRQPEPWYLRRYSRRVRCIRNAVEDFKQIEITDLRTKWGIPADKPMLLSVGRLSRQKNHDTLIQALSSVPDAHLVIVGDGELASESRRQATALSLAERVVFTGEIDREQVYGLMNCADMFVFPSLWEGLSLAALEALSRGMATVASDIPPNREVFGDAAVFVPATNVTALAAGIQRVLDDGFLASSLRLKAVARARSFPMEFMIEAYERLLWSH